MSNEVFQQMLDQARQAITEFNEGLDEADQIKADEFFNCLKKTGGRTAATLGKATWEDLQDCKLPKLLAKTIADIFRQNVANSVKEDKPKYISDKRAAGMSTEELFAAYDPRNSENPVGKLLMSQSKGLPTVVFNPDGSVNPKESRRCLEDIRDGHEPAEIVTVNGKPTKVYKIGDRLDNTVDENPLYPGRALRSDSVCDQTGRSWVGISDTVRQLLRLALGTGELRVTQLGDAHNTLDAIVGKPNSDAEQWARTRFPRASVKHDELIAQGKPPILKIVRGGSSGRKNDPFHGSNHVSY